MKRIASIALALASLVPTVASATSITQADLMTGRSISDAYVAGQLNDRLVELGTFKTTGEYRKPWHDLQEDGVRLHCYRDYANRGVENYAVLCQYEASKYAHQKRK